MSLDIVDALLIAPPINFSAEDDTPAPLPTQDFLESLRTFLLDAPGLEGLTNVYWDDSPPDAEYPFLVFSQLWEDTYLILNHPSYSEAMYQITIFSTNPAEARAMGRAAHDAMMPAEGMEVMLFSEGIELTRAPGKLNGPNAQPQGMIGGEKVWMTNFDCMWIIGQR